MMNEIGLKQIDGALLCDMLRVFADQSSLMQESDTEKNSETNFDVECAWLAWVLELLSKEAKFTAFKQALLTIKFLPLVDGSKTSLAEGISLHACKKTFD